MCFNMYFSRTSEIIIWNTSFFITPSNNDFGNLVDMNCWLALVKSLMKVN